MIRALWSRLSGQANIQTHATLDTDLLVLARTVQSARDLRAMLLLKSKRPDFVVQQIPELIKELCALSWPVLEINKVLAYADFFSGANAYGYQRVMQQSLATHDYPLVMTACIHCYLADKFSEGAALLDAFQPDEDPSTDWCEYLAFAGYIYLTAGRPVEISLACFDKALDRGCATPILATNAYIAYFEAACLARCNTLKQLILSRFPEDPDAITAVAYVELARNYYAEGFRLMEVRYRLPDQSRALKMSLLQRPRWQQQSLVGKSLLVHGEQGLGDMLMMARYLPLLQAKGARLLMDGRAEAASLMTHNYPDCEFVVGELQSPIHQAFDYWIGIMSLPYQFDTTVNNVPAINGYLTAPEEQRSYWRERIQTLCTGTELRVGLTWSGNPGHRADKRRSMAFEVMATLVNRHPDILFFSLQTHVSESHPSNLIDIADELLTLADTAASILEMDLVISVDTSAIHLAGALGHPAWLLLPYRYEWRWGLEGETNAWYSSVCVLRQRKAGHWANLLDEVSQRLQREVQLKTESVSRV